MEDQIIAIVGATGKSGARVLHTLRDRGYQTRALSRNTHRPFDWLDRSTWLPALQGAKTAYVTYFPDLAIPQAKEDIQHFVDVASSSGVQHVVLLSGRGEAGAQQAEAVVQQCGLDWNIIRASWFMQNFSESFMLEGLIAGNLVLPEPGSNEPFVDINDVADVAVAALTNSSLRNQLFEVTGPTLQSFADCVRQIATATARDIGFTALPVDAYLAAARAEGLPEAIAWLINELFVNVLDGRNAFVTDTVEQILGRPAKHFDDYVADVAAQGIWNPRG